MYSSGSSVGIRPELRRNMVMGGILENERETRDADFPFVLAYTYFPGPSPAEYRRHNRA